MTILLTILGYFAVLLLFSRLTTRKSDNETFYRANRRSPWYMVAFGMVGASISGVTFVSVPGMAVKTDMTYMQTCLGFILGYLAVAFVLLPVYYRLNLTTIYTYLLERLGRRSYKTGACFFLLSKMTGAAVRFFVVCFILQRFVLDAAGIPFWVTVPLMVLLIWLYTRRGGIKTLVWTDSFQTLCMFTALILIIYKVVGALDMTVAEAVKAVANDEHSRMFVFGDWVSRQNFLKMFLSGIFITIVMTGLDQDMMQKNMTCRNLRDAQKDMCTYGLAFAPANLLFLSLGVLLMMLARREGLPIPASGDELLPMFAATGALGKEVVVLFTIGIVAASFSSADSALTSLTTSWCVDICERPDDERLRRRSHIGMAVVFTLFILAFRMVNSTSVIDAIYILCSYTYGPLLGLFSFGLFTRRPVNDRLVPYVCIASPLLCLALDTFAKQLFGYVFGYELLMLNGLFTFLGLWFLPGKSRQE
ncbi:MAG: sodium:solute symporter [Prevotella sp.]|nr:sodium:solute symporter [Prevotella sp.]